MAAGGSFNASFRFSANNQSASPFFFQFQPPISGFQYSTPGFQIDPSSTELQYAYSFENASFAPEQGGLGRLTSAVGQSPGQEITNGFLQGNLALAQSSSGIGVYQSSVYGGNGNDIINISGTNFGIKDALISGGDGKDTFSVGRGQGTVDGGCGFDVLKIDYFLGGVKPSDITVSAGACGDVLISGTTDNLDNLFDTNGNSNVWTQAIKGVEQFLVNGVTYSASQFVSAFG